MDHRAAVDSGEVTILDLISTMRHPLNTKTHNKCCTFYGINHECTHGLGWIGAKKMDRHPSLIYDRPRFSNCTNSNDTGH